MSFNDVIIYNKKKNHVNRTQPELTQHSTNMEALFENYFIPFQGDIVQILLNLFAYYLCKGA